MSFIGKLFGKSGAERRLRDFQPSNFRSPGLSGRFNKSTNTFSVSRGRGVDSALSSLRQGLEGRSAAFGELRDQVTPGFGRLTRSRVEAIRNARSRAVGNLREELGKRRVLGSSFAQREIAGVEAQFGQIEEQTRAESFLTELGVNADLIQQEFSGAIEAAQAFINQFNIESSLAAGMATNATNAINSNLQAQAQVAQARRDGIGELIGTIIGSFAPTGEE